jgi:hypothetical protein
VLDLPEGAMVFCSHASLPKRFSLWESSALQLVFTTATVRQKRWNDRTVQILLINHVQLGGTSGCVR